MKRLCYCLKKIGNGIVSNYIYNELKEGDVVEAYPPQENFYGIKCFK